MRAVVFGGRRAFVRTQFINISFVRAITTFKEGDNVLLKHVGDSSHAGYLSKPLNEKETLHTTHGVLNHADVLGKGPRAIVKTKKGVSYSVHECSLADYVVLTKRIVTPIYPAHANLIASLLELHPTQASTSNKLEILEAGTGHGALTLYLARAIHGANPSPPDLLFASDAGMSSNKPEPSTAAALPNDLALSEWKKTRVGIVHTLDIAERHSKHAQTIVRNFRRGLYYGNVDFHVGDLATFCQERATDMSDKEPFLSHVVLDMPATNEQLPIVTPHLQPDGKLLVFNPSITQIVECVRTITLENLPLELERVIELPPGVAGGREWDVRVASIRKLAAQAEQATTKGGWFAWIKSLFSKEAPSNVLVNQPMAFVCRPKTGIHVAVGGFVAMWRKKS